MNRDAPAAENAATERGRRLYNQRCYFCHGYSGDARTEAAKVLSPAPRDFTRAGDLSVERIVSTLSRGRPGTGMKSFAGLLAKEEMRDIAEFVMNVFVARAPGNTRYHTPANGWGDHRERYAAAYPFVTGARPPDPSADLSRAEREGLALFLKACIVCHEGKKPGRAEGADRVWEKYPLSDQGCGVVCHGDNSVSFPWETKRGSRRPGGPRSPYEAHGRSPEIAGLDARETRGRDLYRRNCAFCHAMDGTGGNWIGSFIEPHARDLTDPAVAEALTEARLGAVIGEGIPGTSMSAWRSVLSADEIAAVSAYVRRAFVEPALRRGRAGRPPGGPAR